MRAEFSVQPAHKVNLSVNFHNTALCGQRVPAKRIIGLCAEEFGFHPDQLASARRTRWLCYARFAAWDLLRRHTRLSLPQMGQRFGNRDHTTVIHGLKSSKILLSDPDETRYTEAFERVRERLLI